MPGSRRQSRSLRLLHVQTVQHNMTSANQILSFLSIAVVPQIQLVSVRSDDVP